jgi:hypothetical protein
MSETIIFKPAVTNLNNYYVVTFAHRSGDSVAIDSMIIIGLYTLSDFNLTTTL